MTEKLYDENSFLKEFCACVTECEPYFEKWAVTLDKTAFFPEGGGQPSDTGYLDNAEVLDVQLSGDKIYHITDSPLAVGATVTGVINWERRFDFMQQHSGEHIVSGIAHSLYGCENVGFHLSENIVTLDFDKPLDSGQILKIERTANEKIYENVGFNCYYPDSETLKILNYRSKKEIDGAIRIVEIEGTDLCACCAPHVKTAGQIGIIKIISSENMRGGVRLEIKCGARALADYNEKQSSIKQIGEKLCVKQNETAVAVDRLIADNKELNFEISSLKKRIIAEKAENFKPESDKTAIFENGLDIKELQLFADALCKKAGGIRGVFSVAESGFSFAICGEETALNAFFTEFKKEFSVRGGGRNGMVQGTVAAEKGKIEEFFK